MPETTLADLTALSAHTGEPIKGRLLTEWIQRGLLDSPQRRRGTGYGSQPSIVTDHQRDLFLSLVPHYRSGANAATLANIPLYLWIYWGDDYVPLRQARRAFTTWFRDAYTPAKSHARDLAGGLVSSLAHPAASDTRKRTLQRHLTSVIYEGRIRDADTLHRAFEDVFDPRRSGRTIGPPGVAMNAQHWLAATLMRFHTVHTLAEADKKKTEQHGKHQEPTSVFPDDTWTRARQLQRESLAEYRSMRYTATALWTPSNSPWDGADEQTLITEAGAQLLLALAKIQQIQEGTKA